MPDRARMYYYTMPDGTIKQINPFSGREVWTVPERSYKAIIGGIPKNVKKIEKRKKEDYCDFCESRYLDTPPEKSRLVQNPSGEYNFLEHLPAKELNSSKAAFRRVPNLFEIVSLDYWVKNYDYRLSPKMQRWKQEYLGSKEGFEHVRSILATKLRLLGKTQQEIDQLSDEEISRQSDSFFGGGHELIVARRHYRPDAGNDSELCSSGELTPDEHYAYLKFTIDALRDIYANNRYVRHISVFQNWLASAGASFDHLHKQLVALDDWGASVVNEIELVRKNPNIYNELAVNLAAYLNFVFAENEHAIAFADIGHQYPTLAIYSKSEQGRPGELTEEELRDFSDLLHACYSAMGSQISCNEEWYYTPIDSVVKMPWHILIKWRINITAGFEGGTKIYINPISPIDLRDRMVRRLYESRDKGLVRVAMIAEECQLEPNCLKYYQR